MFRRRCVGQLVVLALPLAVVACGSNSTPVTPSSSTTTTIPADAPAVTLTPTTVAFAGANAGVQTVVLTNSGAAELDISSMTTSGNFAATNDCPPAMAAGATCTISATFRPLAATSPATSSGSVIITDNARDSFLISRA